MDTKGNFPIITKDMFMSNNFSKTLQREIQKAFSDEKNQIEQIISLINLVVNKIKLVMIEKETKGYRYSYKKVKKKTFREIMKLGSMIVFNLRQILLNEKIVFSLGAQGLKGELYERQISQEELFQATGKYSDKLLSSLSEKAINLSAGLEKINNGDFSLVEPDFWSKIQKLAFNINGYNKEKKFAMKEKTITLKNGSSSIKKHYAYQQAKPDENVYVMFRAQKSNNKKKAFKINAYRYYKKDEKKYIYFNNGWLYQWYMSYIVNDENFKNRVEALRVSLDKKDSISPIIKEMDSIAGIKQGDFQRIDKQIQAKFGNRQIITYVSVLKTLEEIQKILKLYKGDMTDTTTMSNKFIELFTTQTNAVNGINKQMNDILKQLIQPIVSQKT